MTSILYFSDDDEAPQILQLPSGDCTKPLGSKENPIQLVQRVCFWRLLSKFLNVINLVIFKNKYSYALDLDSLFVFL